ncbi:hypothetical protein [Spirillospora sp. CA-294931]|uniref:hypothetical protein n=1 Tax=Spirillospora sp. CA-294931 TaxID=3240042 RepID=UPI003D8E53E9
MKPCRRGAAGVHLHRRRGLRALRGLPGRVPSDRGPRIVSLLPAATDIVVEFGLVAHLVGRTHECN